MSVKRIIMPIILSIVCAFGIFSINFAYGYFDQQSVSQNETIPIGNFDNPFVTTYYTGFENYTNTTLFSNINLSIDGVNWQVNSVVVGNTANDLKVGTKSARFNRNAYMNSLDSFTGLRTISFYMGKTVDSPTSGKTYEVAIRDATSNWYIINTGAMPNTFTYFELDVATMIQNGITLSNNVTVTQSTPLFVRIYFNGNQGGNPTRQNMNLDELKITHSS